MAPPTLLRGATAIATCLGLTPGQVSHLDRQRQLPTFRLPGDSTPHATAGGLAEWRDVRDQSSDGGNRRTHGEAEKLTQTQGRTCKRKD